MKTIIALTAMIFAIVSCATSNSIVPDNYELPKFKEIKLDNGLKVLLVPDKKIPFVSINLMLPTGYVADPMTKSGLSSLTFAMLDKGTKARSADRLADDLDYMGVQFSAASSPEYSLIGIDGLSKFQNEILESFSEILFSPKFDSKELAKLKKRVIAGIQKRQDQPDQMADLYAKQFLYGNHPLAKSSMGELADVKGIGVDDLKNYYQKHFVPQGAVLALVGNFSSQFQDRLLKDFSEWKGLQVEPVNYPRVKELDKLSIRLVTKESLKQAQVQLMHFGPGRDTKDYLAIRVANTILGGSFSSRLMDEIRDNRGLTYGIYSKFQFGRGIGEFNIGSYTRVEKVGELVQTSLDIYSKMYKEGVSEAEVNRAKNLILGNFPKAVETPEKLAANLLVLRAYGIGDAYLNNYIDNIESIDVGDVNRVIKKYMKPEAMKVLVYAPEKGVKEQLQKIGILEIKKAY